MSKYSTNATITQPSVFPVIIASSQFSSCTFLTPFEETKKPEIYGIPLPLVDAKIMKDDYTECRYNEIGEIYISSVQRMSGYLANQSETEKFFFKDENGQTWGRTGDLGYVTEDGLFVLTDRKKNMIVRPDGHNVFPNEIEEVITASDSDAVMRFKELCSME